MNGSSTATSATATSTDRPTPRTVLCAYSPRWLSGPTPGYRGLCATWEGDAPAERDAFRAT
jgi:hypothetical protein